MPPPRCCCRVHRHPLTQGRVPASGDDDFGWWSHRPSLYSLTPRLRVVVGPGRRPAVRGRHYADHRRLGRHRRIAGRSATSSARRGRRRAHPRHCVRAGDRWSFARRAAAAPVKAAVKALGGGGWPTSPLVCALLLIIAVSIGDAVGACPNDDLTRWCGRVRRTPPTPPGASSRPGYASGHAAARRPPPAVTAPRVDSRRHRPPPAAASRPRPRRPGGGGPGPRSADTWPTWSRTAGPAPSNPGAVKRPAAEARRP
jgi:hypothetical protein